MGSFRPSVAAALAVGCLALPSRSPANTLELALVIDGSTSIVPSDWALQVGAYQNVFQDNFYSTYIAPSPYDDIVVAAYVFSGGNVTQQGTGTVLETLIVTSYLDWTVINDDTDASAFGALLGALVQPGGQTHTSGALNIAANGGVVGCIYVPSICNVSPSETVPGLLNNAYNGDVLEIDISTDGVPTLPNAHGDPNLEPQASQDRALAIAAANAARAAGITINAIGVGSGVDTAFLTSLVGIDPTSAPTGFYLTASGFSQFNDGLQQKIGRETSGVPVTPALPLALTAFGSALLWRRKRAALR